MPERLDKTNKGFKLVVDNTLENINRVEATATHCASGLSDSQSQLESCDDVIQLKSLVSDILGNTQRLTASSHDLKQELMKSTEEIAKLREELEAVKETARTDGLTGLLNRGAFNRELATLCAEGDTVMALALFDIDHFKNINDSFGHLLGDKVLQYFATILTQNRDDIHLAARFGGEELAMIFLHSSEQEAFHITETIRKQFASSRLKKKGSDESIGQVTVSAGIALYQEGDTPQSLIMRADEALYVSKSAGRNQTSIYQAQ